jgi:CRP-like cAMP-binding protein
MASKSQGVQTIVKDCLVDLPFFAKFDVQELDFLEKKLEMKRYIKGEFVFREGEPGTFMGFVVKGTLEVVKENAKGQLKRLVEIKKGLTFGEMALADSYARSATIMVKEPSELLILTRDKLDEICARNPEVGIKILQGVARLLSLNLRRTSGILSDYLER